MNEVCFNNLSSFPICSSSGDADERVNLYIQTLKEVGNRGIKHVRYKSDLTTVPICENLSLQDYCNTHIHSDAVRLILSMATQPQVPEDDDELVEEYLVTETTLEKDGEFILADGFNAAFCMGTYCVGFVSEAFWDKPLFRITVTSNGREENHQWSCVSTPEHVHNSAFQTWWEQFLPLELLETGLLPDQKKIELGKDHHGNDKLTEHAARLIKSPYVEGILTSLEYKEHAKSYVSKYSDFAHGLLDLVLLWETHGYSMRVKTTGRNIRETKLIAEILTEEYGHGKR